MRVVLVGTLPARRRLRGQLPESLEVVGEGSSLSEARLRPAGVDAYLVAPDDGEDDEPLVEQLTARETEVLSLLAEGLSNRGIAGRLGVSDETIKFHLSSIFGKLHASNRTEAVRQAIRRGLVAI